MSIPLKRPVAHLAPTAEPAMDRSVADLHAGSLAPGQTHTVEGRSATWESWPEIDRLTANATVNLALCPSVYCAVKVLFDYLVVLLLLPLAVPIILLAALAVRLSTPGPAFYTQTRIGLSGRRFRILKIRTMHHNCEITSGIKWAGTSDSRITGVGRVLRATHIDELPQLFNVLFGQMSLIGPRPERPEVILSKRLDQLVPGYRHRLLVKPGVTGLAQLQLPPDRDVASVRYKVVYDLYYVQNQSLLLDLRILMATAFKALRMGPHLLRRLFLLPNRLRVAEVFHANVTVVPSPLPQLQPV
jgi:lipopolysaccharide/colanic/teichoic acid biosynthesis glycosyltransferase